VHLLASTSTPSVDALHTMDPEGENPVSTT